MITCRATVQRGGVISRGSLILCNIHARITILSLFLSLAVTGVRKHWSNMPRESHQNWARTENAADDFTCHSGLYHPPGRAVLCRAGDALWTPAPLTDTDLWFVIRCQSKVEAPSVLRDTLSAGSSHLTRRWICWGSTRLRHHHIITFLAYEQQTRSRDGDV